jgi:hypothetical protein
MGGSTMGRGACARCWSACDGVLRRQEFEKMNPTERIADEETIGGRVYVVVWDGTAPSPVERASRLREIAPAAAHVVLAPCRRHKLCPRAIDTAFRVDQLAGAVEQLHLDAGRHLGVIAPTRTPSSRPSGCVSRQTSTPG